MKRFTFAAAVALAAAPLLCATSAQAFDLTVEVLNARSDQGLVLAAVYGAEAGWLKSDQAVQAQRAPAAAKTVIVYRDLPAGSYAVSSFHDENGNGKLDTNVVGFPTERFGFSRDAVGRMGPPSFADAAIDLQRDTTITINLH
jgi:uncharacterized protein (DUF2141 family)